jgi:hypothetical protein
MSQSKKINDTKLMIKLADMCVFLKPWRSPGKPVRRHCGVQIFVPQRR